MVLKLPVLFSFSTGLVPYISNIDEVPNHTPGFDIPMPTLAVDEVPIPLVPFGT